MTLSESRAELAEVAASHGRSLDGIDIYELTDRSQTEEEGYTIFHPAEVELQQTMDAVLGKVEETNPIRVVFDSGDEAVLLHPGRNGAAARRQDFAGR